MLFFQKSKTLPQCVQDEDCHVSFCACCGECTKETNYRLFWTDWNSIGVSRCKIQSGIDCQKKDMRVDRKGDNKMTPEERAAGSEFFKRAMSYMNDTTFDWDKENPSWKIWSRAHIKIPIVENLSASPNCDLHKPCYSAACDTRSFNIWLILPWLSQMSISQSCPHNLMPNSPVFASQRSCCEELIWKRLISLNLSTPNFLLIISPQVKRQVSMSVF